jgi:hypothetical protein
MKKPTPANPCPADGRDVRISLDPIGGVVLTTPDGHRFVGVEPVRAFPITDPGGLVSFCDAHGAEVFCLRSIAGLDPASKKVLEEELSSREFVPVIRRIVRVTGEATPSDWEVETDRGPARFTLDNEDDIRHLGPQRLFITDSRKLRYQIVDVRALDGHSRRLLEKFL